MSDRRRSSALPRLSNPSTKMLSSDSSDTLLLMAVICPASPLPGFSSSAAAPRARSSESAADEDTKRMVRGVIVALSHRQAAEATPKHADTAAHDGAGVGSCGGA